MAVLEALERIVSINRTNTINDTHDEITVGSKVAIGIAVTGCNLVIILGNALVILAIALNRKLRTVTNCFVLNLAIADMTLGILVLPFSMILLLEKRWMFGRVLCNLWAAVDVLCCTASILSLCAISVDRYIGVTKPLKHKNMRKKTAYVAIAVIWSVSLVLSIVGPLIKGKLNSSQTDHTDDCTVVKSAIYVLASASCSFYIPALVIIIIYMKIYQEAIRQYRFLLTGIKQVKGVGNNSSSPLLLRAHSRKVSTASQVRRSSTTIQTFSERSLQECNSNNNNKAIMYQDSCKEKVTYSSTKTTVEMKMTCTQNEKDSRHRSREKKRSSLKESLNARLVVFNSEKRAAKTLGIVVGAFMMCWLPFFIILPIDALCPDCIPGTLFDVVFWLGYCNSMVNPAIYALWMKEFSETFVAILCCRWHDRRKRLSNAAVKRNTNHQKNNEENKRFRNGSRQLQRYSDENTSIEILERFDEEEPPQDYQPTKITITE